MAKPTLRTENHKMRPLFVLALSALLATNAAAQEPIDSAINAQIRTEAFEHSQVLETALGLSDYNGPRLAGSPLYLRAAHWARDRMAAWGLSKAALEPWGAHPRSWVLERFSVEMNAPYYLRLNAFPRAWNVSTPGPISGSPVLVSIRSDSDFATYRGKLRGKVVLNGAIRDPRSREEQSFHRLTDTELDSLERLADPGSPRDFWDDLNGWLATIKRRREIMEFYRREGALALLEPSGGDLMVRADGNWTYPAPPWRGVPTFVVARDHYDRVARLIEHSAPVRLTLSLRGHLTTGDSTGYNVVAELPGTDPALGSELVMMGGHLDSWISGTGATDNAAGCAVVMEALRVLKAIGAQPRRTIRVALWDAEEPSDDYAGSLGYVKRHFGDPYTMKLLPGHEQLSAYFNLDNGAGRIRGIYLQGNQAAGPILAALLEPFRDVGAAHVTIANTGSTDHLSFVSVGLPGFEFLQDPLDYESRTHHSNLDVGDYLIEDDLKQAAAIVASVVYHVATRDEKLPRVVAVPRR